MLLFVMELMRVRRFSLLAIGPIFGVCEAVCSFGVVCSGSCALL
jgi:hypothetical protein